ncbi:MAG: 3H domain-containing protein, partial [Bacillota bacterium]|nr:3H domain-containing protein [Bacillota bacterium]
IEHAIYGEISGKLDLSSRYDVDLFMEKVEKEKNSAPISSLTGGVHLHRIGCKDKAAFSMIKAALSEKGILIQ